MGNGQNKIIIHKLDNISKKIDSQNYDINNLKNTSNDHSIKINEIDNRINIIDEKVDLLQNSMDQWSNYYMKHVHSRIFTTNDSNKYFSDNQFELSQYDYGEPKKNHTDF